MKCSILFLKDRKTTNQAQTLYIQECKTCFLNWYQHKYFCVVWKRASSLHTDTLPAQPVITSSSSRGIYIITRFMKTRSFAFQLLPFFPTWMCGSTRLLIKNALHRCRLLSSPLVRSWLWRSASAERLTSTVKLLIWSVKGQMVSSPLSHKHAGWHWRNFAHIMHINTDHEVR